MKWIQTQYPGVRYREHTDRKHQGNKDRYFVIRYKKDGKLRSEAVGWSTAGVNAQKANLIRAEIVQNIREGRRPQSLNEKREIERQVKNAKLIEQEIQKKREITFNEIAKKFLEWSEVNKKDYSNDSSRYMNHLKDSLGQKKITEITTYDIETLKTELVNKGLSPKTVHHCLSLVRSIYSKASVWNFFEGVSPTDKITWPRLNNNRERFLTTKEACMLICTLKETSAIVHGQAIISLYCGLRFGEIAKLTWNDIDLDNGIINITDTKNSESRKAYINTPVKIVLERFQKLTGADKNNRVFPSKSGKQQQHVSTSYYRIVNELGLNEGVKDKRLKVCFHTLRHTFASWLAIQGTSLYEIKELMGHKTIAMTERYAHLLPNVKRDAVNKLAASSISEVGLV
jgi:integrase